MKNMKPTKIPLRMSDNVYPWNVYDALIPVWDVWYDDTDNPSEWWIKNCGCTIYKENLYETFSLHMIDGGAESWFKSVLTKDEFNYIQSRYCKKMSIKTMATHTKMIVSSIRWALTKTLEKLFAQILSDTISEMLQTKRISIETCPIEILGMKRAYDIKIYREIPTLGKLETMSIDDISRIESVGFATVCEVASRASKYIDYDEQVRKLKYWQPPNK